MQRDQAKDNVLLLGRVHVVAQGVGGGPELGLKAEVGGGGVFFGRAIGSRVKVKGVAHKMHRDIMRHNADKGLAVMTGTNTLFLVTARR